MKPSSRFAAILLLLCAGFTAADNSPAIPEVFPEPAIEADEQAFEQELRRTEIYQEITGDAPRLGSRHVITVPLTDEDRQRIGDGPRSAADEPAIFTGDQRFRPAKPVLVGLAKPVDLSLDLSGETPADLITAPSDVARGLLQTNASGSLTWTTVIHSPGATALRLRFADFDLPPGAEVFLYNDHGDVVGPYSGPGPDGDGDFWSHTVNGERVQVLLRFPGLPFVDDLQAVSFRIAEVSHLGSRFQIPSYSPGGAAVSPFEVPRSLCGFNAPCVEDASCYGPGKWSQINTARRAIAHITYQQGAGSYICSGGLIADNDPNTQVPLFLTAHHCIGSNQEAQTVQAFWRFQTASCGAACFAPEGRVPTTRGATLLSASPNTDYALLRLDQAPPAGSWYLGWTAAQLHASQGTRLYRLAHPKGAPLAYSEHSVDTSAGICGTWPRGNFIYSADVIGATQGGSSGSPVTNVQGQIVGQLSGACGPQSELSDDCSSQIATVDGAFSRTFPNIRQWLQPNTSATLPTAPSVLAATAAPSSEINLSWRDNANNESGYRLERRTGTNGAWSEVAVLGANTTSYRDRGLSAATRYFYRIRSYNGEGNSAYSNLASVVTTSSVNCTANIDQGRTIKGSWVANCASTHRSGSYARYYRFTLAARTTVTIDLIGTEDTYLFLLNGNNASAAIHSQDDDGGVNTNSRISTTLNAGVYTVEATTYFPNRTGSFDISLLGASGTAPSAPSDLAATAVAWNRINLTWRDNANNEAGFRIERKTGADGAWAQRAVVGANVTSYADTGLSASTTYSYRLRSYRGNSSSSYSNEASAGTPSRASCSGTLPLNQTVNGSWSSSCRSTHRAGSYARFYSFSLSATTPVTIDLSSSEDSFVYLLNGGANGSIVTFDDDGGTGRNSRISRSLAAGTYTIEATTYSSAVTGSFSLSLQNAPRPAAPSNLNANVISSTVIDLSWQDNAVNETGTRIERKTGANGTWVLLANKGANATFHRNAGLSPGTTYYYRSRTFNGSGVSAYSNETSATTSAAANACFNTIRVGQTINGSWSNNCLSKHRAGSYARFYTFTLTAPTFVTIDLSSNEDSYLYLLSGGVNGSVIAFNDDAGATLDSALFGTLAAGTYTIEATTFFSATTGSFTLTFQDI